MEKAPSTDGEGFRMRGTQVSRVEGISDAVFGLAITLIVVSLKPPESFAELTDTLQGFIGSGFCSMILFQIWNRHYLYFRRYGLEDGITRLLNGILLFVVIAYVYPLKFLFTLFFDSFRARPTPIVMHRGDQPHLFVIYGAGFATVYSLFGLMYRHALGKRRELELNELEALQTRWIIFEHFLMAGVGILQIIIAAFGPGNIAYFSWGAYFLIPVVLSIHGSKHADAVKVLKREQGVRASTPLVSRETEV